MGPNTISFVFSVLTIIVGGACIMLYVNTKTLRDSRDDMEHRIDQLEDERARDKETIASQKTELGIWRKAVTGEDQLNEISKLLNKHHRESTDQAREILVALSHVGTRLDSLDDHVIELIAVFKSAQGETT